MSSQQPTTDTIQPVAAPKATKAATPKQPAPVDPYKPVDWDAHQEDLRRRAEERDKKRDVLMDCLDYERAKLYEANKPVYEYLIEATFRRKDRRGRFESVTETVKVAAQSESDAWAKFCDQIGVWPSRRDCRPNIKRLKKITG